MGDPMLKLWLASSDINSKEKRYIDENFKNSDELYGLLRKEKNSSPYRKKLDKLLKVYEEVLGNNTLDYLDKSDIGIVCIKDKEYPEMLRKCGCPPYMIFYRGDIQSINKSVNLAVVGSRKSSLYGQNVTDYIMSKLKMYEMRLNVVSGMARGIDSIAHRAAMDNGFTTTAVLGCGIDVIYPRENKKLYEDILKEGGCIISQFPIGTQPLPRNFPIRNSVISGISDVVLVVEGGDRSGTLITAGEALDQGRSVITVPGSIFSETSIASNRLIRDGAYVFTEIQDLVDLLNNSCLYKNNNSEISPKISEKEKILELMSEEPMHIDDIVSSTDIDIKRIYKLLFDMQQKKEILCLSGNFYVKVNKI